MDKKIDIIELLESGKAIQINPQGYSMYPLLVPGRDAVIIVKADSQKLKRGDVILYRREKGILVLHRIWKITKEELYLVGDNQVAIEGPLRKEQVKGIMVAFIRKGRKISKDNILYLMLSGVWLYLRPFRKSIKSTASVFLKLFRMITKK